jgi:hypothetical protein
MYQLGLCELHCWRLHGGDPMLGHYLLIYTYPDLHSRENNDSETDSDSDTDSDTDSEMNIFDEAIVHNEYYAMELFNTTHCFIRNYTKIIKQPAYIKPEIMQIVILETGESVCILKTFWLRVFQRMWRRKYAKFLSTIKNINNINMSRLTGRLKKR